jgi:hypothetical protein
MQYLCPFSVSLFACAYLQPNTDFAFQILGFDLVIERLGAKFSGVETGSEGTEV